MLTQLFIENIAVIEKAAIQFGGGLNVFTGETGAGKSILIDSINAVLGARTSRDLVRTGAGRAVVSALFTEIGHAAAQALARLGFETEEGSVLLQREISAEGKSACRIDGRPATAAILREAGAALINIHGQHDNQALLQPERHIDFVDAYGGLEALRADYGQCFRDYLALQKQLQSLQMDEGDKARRIDLLRFQIEDIESAALTPDEEEELLARRRKIQNAEKITESLAAAHAALDGDGESEGGVSALSVAADCMQIAAAYIEELAEPAGRVQEMVYELQECAADLADYLEESEYDPAELDRIESRLDVIFRLKKKYGGSTEKILAYLESAREELMGIETADEQVEKLTEQLHEVKRTLTGKANTLSEARRRAYTALLDGIAEELRFLDMPHVRMSARHEQVAFGASGADEIEFLIVTNPGETPKPLAKVASGGELSRVMLAIKSVSAHRDSVDTMIFDEIDTGVSGRAAQKIGRKLLQIAQDRQVICVTHQPQIAARADVHMLISKQVEGGRTYTRVEALDGEGRGRELARIIGGDDVTETLLQNAAEMLDAAQDERARLAADRTPE